MRMLSFSVIPISWMLSACPVPGQTPHDPLWNKQTCKLCRMVLSQPRYAAQIIGPGRAVHYYDDLGCALKDQVENPELTKGALYVRPHGGETWELAREALYQPSLPTPMDYGFGAVRNGGTLHLRDVEAALAKRIAH